MGIHNSDMILDVMERIKTSYSGKAENADATLTYIDEAIQSLAPFEIDQWVKDTLNKFLVRQQANKLACMAAWALYKDYHLINAREYANS